MGLVPDGIAGIFYAREPAEVVPVATRMGAAKLALETGTTLQPAYLLGNSQPLSIWCAPPGRTSAKQSCAPPPRSDRRPTRSSASRRGRYDDAGVLRRLSRRCRVMLAPVWGRWGLPVPRRVPITWALGEALHVVRVEPAQIRPADVERVHAQLLARLQDVYATYAPLYGWGDRKLVFV